MVAFVKELAFVVVGAVVVAALLRGFVGQMFIIPSPSMENTLLVNDRVLVEKLSSVKRGQVVVFEDPGRWLSEQHSAERGAVGQALEFIGVLPDTSTKHLIKRAIGLPGDHVVCCDSRNRITVNEQALDETSYLFTESGGLQSEPSTIKFNVTVPAGHIFVLGDNRTQSRDSRCHLNDVTPGKVRGSNAFVPEDLVVGRAVAVVWPFDQADRLRTPSTFADVPSSKQPPAAPTVFAGADANC